MNSFSVVQQAETIHPLDLGQRQGFFKKRDRACGKGEAEHGSLHEAATSGTDTAIEEDLVHHFCFPNKVQRDGEKSQQSYRGSHGIVFDFPPRRE